ncbi:hypothetical protein HNO53_01030 [Billgrantia antri]|uniref:Lipoprotein n=1 Tax=Halomonas sulfidivorans TaxID=2733488 RepID=A0ABX7WAN3_9GAMM|nr:hypothetical protein [Halomonas sulfidivorans]QTP57428.1 hypothetical protein HNO53_01030 [Halomonas sulfidivorans]
MKRIIALLTLFFLQGCTSLDVYKAYEGELSMTERAYLQGIGSKVSTTCGSGEPMVLFTAIDARATIRPMTTYANGCRYPSEVLIRPGRRNIQALYSYGSSPRNLFSCFVAKAGKSYKAEVVIQGYSPYMVVFEMSGQEGQENYIAAEMCPLLSLNEAAEG